MSFIKRSLTNIGILPSYVRYSNKISAEEKVLYSELTSLANNFEDINIKESDYAKKVMFIGSWIRKSIIKLK